MREIKLHKQLLAIQIGSLKDACSNIDTSGAEVSNDGVSTLDTSVKYIEQHKQISELLKIYKQLIEKDAEDIKEMQKAVTLLDVSISETFKKSGG